MLNFLISFSLNLFCVLCIFLVDELKKFHFFLINFQCSVETIGALFWLLHLFMVTVLEYFDYYCSLENDYDYELYFEVG